MARRLTFDDPADVVPTPTRASLPSVGTYRPSTLLANGVGLQSVKLFVGSVALVAVLYVIIKSVFRWLATLKRKRAVELKVDPPPEWVGPGCQLEGFFVGTTVSVTAICEGHTNEEAIILSRFESKLNDARGEDGYVALERVGVTRDRMTWTSQPLKELGKYRIQYICQKPNAKKIEIITSVSFTVTAPRLELAQTVALWKDSVNVRITASPSHPSSDTIVLLPHSGGEDRIEELQQRYVGRDLSSLEVAAVSSVKVPSVAGGEPVDVALPGSTRQGPFVVAYLSGTSKQLLACSSVLTVAGPTLRHMKPQALGESESLFWNESLAISVAANQSHAGDHLVLRKVGDSRVPEQALPIPDRTPSVVSFQGKHAPRYPGSYFVHYVCASGETLTALGPITIRGPQLKPLHPNSEESAPAWNDPVSVEIEASDKRSTSDIVVLVRTGDIPGKPLAAKRVVSHQLQVPQPTSRRVVCTFANRDAPGFPGTYRFHYYCDRGGSISGEPDCVSEEFVVRPPRLEVTSSSLYWAETASVVFEAGALHDSRDYVALAEAGRAPLVISGIFGSTPLSVPVPKGPAGTLHFEGNNAPPVPGRYEFVYFGVAADNPTLLGGAKPEEMARSEPFDVLGPSLRCSLAPLDLMLPEDSFLVPTDLTEMCPPRILVGYGSSYNHSSKDWIGVARVGGEPNTGETSGCWQRVPPAQRGIVSFDQSSLPNKRGEFEFCYVEGLTKAVIGRGGPFTIDIGPKREVIARVTAPEPSRAYLPSAPPAMESSVPEKVVVGEPVPAQGGKHVGVCSVPLGLPVDVPEPVNAIVTPTKPPAPVIVSQPVVDVPKPPVVAVEVVVPVPVVAPIAAVPDVPKPPAVVLETHVPAPAPTSVVAPAPAPAPDAVSAEQPQAAASSTGDVPAKYLQMKKMNLPDHVIRQRMTLDGMDASVIDAFVGPGEPQVAAASRPTPPKPPAPPKPPVAPVATSNPAPTKPAPTPVVPAANPAAASAPKPVTSLPPLSKDKDLDLNMCLSQFRTLRPPSRFAEAMQQCDAAAMNGEDGLDLLEPRVPLGEDARPFLAFVGDVSTLPPTQLFLLTMATVPRCPRKLHTLRFVWTWESRMKKVMEPCNAVASAMTAFRSWTELGTVRAKLNEVMGAPMSIADPAVWSRKVNGGDSTALESVTLAFARAKTEWKPAPAAVRKASTFVPSDLRKEIASVQGDMARARDEARACADSDGAPWATFAAKVSQACEAADRAASAANAAIQSCEAELASVGREVGLGDSTAAAGGGVVNAFLALKDFSDAFDKAMEKAKRIAARDGKGGTPAPVGTSSGPKGPPAPPVAPKTIQEMLNAKFSGARGIKPEPDDSSDGDADW